MIQPHEVATAPSKLSSCGHVCTACAAAGLSLGLLHMGERHRDTGLTPEEVRRFNFWESLSPKPEKSPRAKARAAGVSWRASATARLPAVISTQRMSSARAAGPEAVCAHTHRTHYILHVCMRENTALARPAWAARRAVCVPDACVGLVHRRVLRVPSRRARRRGRAHLRCTTVHTT